MLCTTKRFSVTVQQMGGLTTLQKRKTNRGTINNSCPASYALLQVQQKLSPHPFAFSGSGLALPQEQNSYTVLASSRLVQTTWTGNHVMRVKSS